MANEHAFLQRIYVPHTDLTGVVYHGQYIAFCDMARTEWLRAKGHDLSSMFAKTNTYILIKDVQITYNKPARMDDLLVIKSSVEKIGNASATIRQRICLADKNNQEIAELAIAHVVMVCVRGGEATPWPDAIRELFTLDFNNNH